MSMTVPQPPASPLHHAADLIRDVLAVWGGVSLILVGIGKAFSWRNRRHERRERALAQKIYRFLLESRDDHSVEGIHAEIVVKPLLDNIKLKYALPYETFPGWRTQLGILYWSVILWWRKLGSASKDDVGAIVAEMHRKGELEVTGLRMYRCARR